MKALVTACALVLLTAPAAAQDAAPCRIFCAPEFNVEPTVTFSGGHRDFEIILAVGLPTRLSWLELTTEAIFLPFDRESTPELEFECNLTWLPASRTRGWVSSHFDIVDKFSPAERPTDRRAYTHKLNLELDTSVAVFNWIRQGRWLRAVEVEGSLDYVATGLPRDANRWSFSLVFVLPIAR